MIVRLWIGWLLHVLQPTYWVRAWEVLRFDPGRRARFQAAQWLAAQHYVNEDHERFLVAVDAARRLGGVGGNGICGEGVFLPDVLYANHLLAQGQAKDAIALYETLIREQSKWYAASGRYSNPEERRNVEAASLSLGLLHCDLASALAADGRGAEVIDGALAAALRYLPDSRYVCETVGNEFARRKEWDRARAVYRDAWRLYSGADGEELYANDIAYLKVKQAADLEEAGKLDEAIDVLEGALAEVTKAEKGWIAKVNVVLAGLYSTQERAGEARTAYRSSVDQYAGAEDYSSASYVQSFLVDYLLGQRRHSDALEACDEALRFLERIKEPSAGQRELWRDVTARAGVLRLTLGDKGARQQLDDWRRRSSEISRWDPYSPVANVKSIQEQPRLAGALRGYLDSQLRQVPNDAEGRALVEGARSLWHGALWDEADGEAPKVVEMLNVMTPIALEVAADVLDGFGDKVILEAFGRLVRENLEQRYGVGIPGMRLRYFETGQPGDYQILVHETRREWGELRMEAMAVMGAATLQGVQTEPVVNHLVQEWHWIPAHAAEAAKRAGLDVRTPLELLMHHVEQTLAANLVDFLAHQEVQNLLEKHELMKPSESQKIVTMESARHMDPLAKVLRALAAERVPLTAFRAIYGRYAECRAAGAPVADVVEDIRQMDGVREELWGNDGLHRLWMLGARFESELERHLATQPGEAVLMTRQEREALLAPIRERIRGATRVALIVPRQRHRALARAVVATEFPYLPVLSRRELRAGLAASLAGTIELREATTPQGAPKST